MFKKIFPFLFVFFALAACSQTNGEENHNAEDTMPEMIDVELTAPQEVPAGKSAAFEVTVKQGENPIDDAEEVVFEIWKTDDKDNSVKIEAEPAGDGIYTAQHTVEESGEFHVQSHVTANSMHVMPEKTFTVTSGE